MFLSRKKAESESQKIETPPKEESLGKGDALPWTREELEGAIDKASTSAGAFEISQSEDSLSALLKPAANALRRKTHQMLENIVNIWVAQTAPLLGIAEMFQDMRELEERTQGMAAAAEEMTSSISEVARSADSVAQDANIVKQDLRSGVEQVREALTSMDDIAEAFKSMKGKVDALDEASDQIASILKTIEKIAAQTNLLALNATIEAARAGDAGRGFAVVAGEVKTLAGQTSSATEDIRQRILTLREGMNEMLSSMTQGEQRVEQGTTVIHGVNEHIGQIGERVEDVTQKMMTVSGTVQEQTSAVQEVNGNISSIAKMSKHVIVRVENVIESMEKASEHVKIGLEQSTKQLDTEMLILVAKADHASFKKRIIDTILGKDHQVSSEIGDHHSCRLGKWYDKVDEVIKEHPAYKKLQEPHTRVHAAGRRVLQLCEEKDIKGALEESSRLDKASLEVIGILEELRREIFTEK